jgi:hypothetical protein
LRQQIGELQKNAVERSEKLQDGAAVSSGNNADASTKKSPSKKLDTGISM